MSRRSPLGFVLSLGLEVALVVLIVSALPRVDLSGGRAGETPQPAGAVDFAGQSLRQAMTETSLKLVREAQPADSPPRLTPIGATAARAAEPPPLLETGAVPVADSWRPAERAGVDSQQESQYAEQRLDRASQTLLNGLGSYVARSAGHLLQPADEQAAPATTTASAMSHAATIPPPVPPPSFSTAASPPRMTTPPQIVIPAPAAGNSAPSWTGSFPIRPDPTVTQPAPAPPSRFVRWRNY